MVNVIFQKREFSKKAAKYFPEDYAYPFKEQFRGSIRRQDLHRLRDILLIECEKRGIDVSGDWQAIIYTGFRCKRIYIGRF